MNMQTKGLMAIAAIMAAAFATAHSAGPALYYQCTNVGDVAEYTLEINLNTGKAAFFDNDSWAVLPQKSVGQFESLPPQMVYKFQDNTGSKKIWFNQTRLSGSVTLNAGTPHEYSMKTTDACRVVNVQNLYSGI